MTVTSILPKQDFWDTPLGKTLDGHPTAWPYGTNDQGRALIIGTNQVFAADLDNPDLLAAEVVCRRATFDETTDCNRWANTYPNRVG